ncbi:neuromedin-U receptor 2-like [Diadema antillarum]|uniref:neuromedin-U receptor 2-like n=1 Tax=Diadema antillarum TaxID=105358 RepID=UPI003A8A972D
MNYTLFDNDDQVCDGVRNLTLVDEEEFLPNEVEVVIKAYVLPCVLAVGLFGNILFLIVVVRVPSIRTITNLYLVNLAVADLIYLTVGVGEKLWRFQVSPLANDETPKGPIGCPTISFVIDLAYNASVLLITAVTIERYYAICKPFWHLKITTWRRTRRIVFLNWTASVALAGVLVPGRCIIQYTCLIYPDDPSYDDFPTLSGTCGTPWPFFLVLGNALELIPFFIALFLNCVLYTNIVRSLTDRIKTDLSSHNDRCRYTKDRNTVTRMLVVSGVMFLLLHTPYHVVTLVFAITGTLGADAYYSLHSEVSAYWPVFQTLMYINSASNAYIYGATNAKYRQALFETFSRHQEETKDAIDSIAKKSSTTPSTISDDSAIDRH